MFIRITTTTTCTSSIRQIVIQDSKHFLILFAKFLWKNLLILLQDFQYQQVELIKNKQFLNGLARNQVTCHGYTSEFQLLLSEVGLHDVKVNDEEYPQEPFMYSRRQEN